MCKFYFVMMCVCGLCCLNVKLLWWMWNYYWCVCVMCDLCWLMCCMCCVMLKWMNLWLMINYYFWWFVGEMCEESVEIYWKGCGCECGWCSCWGWCWWWCGEWVRWWKWWWWDGGRWGFWLSAARRRRFDWGVVWCWLSVYVGIFENVYIELDGVIWVFL